MIDPASYIKALILRWTCPLFYKHIGRHCTFHGRVRLPLPLRNIVIGDKCMIGDSIFFYTGRHSEIIIGNNSSINSGSHIVASERIVIGENVAIGEYVSIRDQEHYFNPEYGVREQGYYIAPIEIGSNVWIGRGVYIGPGTTIASGTVVGANSVVRGTFPAKVLIAGVPATVRKSLA